MVLPKNAADKLDQSSGWMEKRTNKSILDELQTRRNSLPIIIKRKMAFFGHAWRNNRCNLVRTCLLGIMLGKRREQYIDNIKCGQGHP